MSSINEEFLISKYDLITSLKVSGRSKYIPLIIVKDQYILTYFNSKIVLLDIKSLSEICSIKEEEETHPYCNYILKLKDDRYALGYRHGDIKILKINLDLKEMKIAQTMKIDNEYISTIIELTNDNLLCSCIYRKVTIFKKNEKGEYYKLKDIKREEYGFDSVFQVNENIFFGSTCMAEEISLYNFETGQHILTKNINGITGWPHTSQKIGQNYALVGGMTKLYLIDLTNLNIINQIVIEQIESILCFNGYIFAGGKSGDEVKIFQYKLKEEEKTLEKISELKLKNIIDGVGEIIFFKYGKYPTLYISSRTSSNNCPINIYGYHN